MKSTYLLFYFCFSFRSTHFFPSAVPPTGHLSLFLRETPKKDPVMRAKHPSFCEVESPEEEAIEISKRSRPRGAIL